MRTTFVEPNTFKVGDRVQVSPGCSCWMRGDRFGTVVGFGRLRDYVDGVIGTPYKAMPVRVKMDVSGHVIRFHPFKLTAV